LGRVTILTLVAGQRPQPAKSSEPTRLLDRRVRTDACRPVHGSGGGLRNTGKAVLATLQAGEGTHLQAMLSLDKGARRVEAPWRPSRNRRIVYVHGTVNSSRRGDSSSWPFLEDGVQSCGRCPSRQGQSEEYGCGQRYVDDRSPPGAHRGSTANPVVGDEQFVERRGFLEVETPSLQNAGQRAAARPFSTHSNALARSLPEHPPELVPQKAAS